MNNEIVTCIIEPGRIFYPKNKTKIETGEFGIFIGNITAEIDNCENLNGVIKLKGRCCEIEYDNKYKVQCILSDQSEKYGDTYEIIYINSLIDLSDKVKQRKFLLSILNETTVNRLFEKYDDIVSLLENEDYDSLCSVKGVGIKSAMKLVNKYKDSKDYSEIYVELGHLGMSTKLIKKLVDFYNSPDTVINIIKNDVYKLVEIDGIGFKKADSIALKMGIDKNDPRRVEGCMIHILTTNGEIGKSYLHYSDLLKQVNEIIGIIPEEIIQNVAKSLIESNNIHLSENGEFIGLKRYYNLEKSISVELKRLNEAECNIKIKDIDKSIKKTEDEQGFEFTDEQKDAILAFVNNNVIALTGGAGTGKTSVSRGMINLVKDKYNISAGALSGKASVRIQEATEIEAQTIHRLLGYQGGEFTYNENCPLNTDVVFIDESTMPNGDLFLSLLKAIPSGCKLVLMGDIQQLTPIGSCQVFADILASSKIKSVKLTKPHRQALRSGIIPLSMKIINQQSIFESSFQGNMIVGELKDMELDIFKGKESQVNKVVNHFLKHYKRTNDLMETQIIVPMKNRGNFSTYSINTEVQKNINPINPKRKNITIQLDKDKFYTIQIGDKVINTKNNYKAKNTDGKDVAVYNGNMGIVKDIDDEFVIIDFVGIGEVVFSKSSCNSIELGYAITVHKSQGSGFKTVIGAIDSSAYVLLNAELLYTLVTRAKDYCVLVGQNNAIKTAITKREIKNKQTYLKQLI